MIKYEKVVKYKKIFSKFVEKRNIYNHLYTFVGQKSL